MEQPRLSGFTKDARAYEFTADAAAQDLTKPDIVELRNIHAKVQMQDKSTMEMTAVTGIYDTKGETLKLERNILLTSSTGYKGRLSEAMVDIRKGNVVSDQPVELEMLQGTLNANRLEIVDSGDLVRFHGGVDMVMMLNDTAPAQTENRHAMTVIRRLSWQLLIAAALVIPGTGLHAQPVSKGPPNALQGFSQNRDQPVHIEAATLEVRDKDKVATFSGNVKVTQGDTGMRCKSLLVFYEQDGEDADKGKTMQAATPGPGGQQKIKRLEARGGVVVTQKEQTATGDLGIFDMKTNTVTLTGNVMMTQGQNVLRGDRLVVDLTSGVSRVESGKNGQGRVQGLFQPGGAGPDLKPGGTNGRRAPNPGAAIQLTRKAAKPEDRSNPTACHRTRAPGNQLMSRGSAGKSGRAISMRREVAR